MLRAGFTSIEINRADATILKHPRLQLSSTVFILIYLLLFTPFDHFGRLKRWRFADQLNLSLLSQQNASIPTPSETKPPSPAPPSSPPKEKRTNPSPPPPSHNPTQAPPRPKHLTARPLNTLKPHPHPPPTHRAIPSTLSSAAQSSHLQRCSSSFKTARSVRPGRMVGWERLEYPCQRPSASTMAGSRPLGGFATSRGVEGEGKV